jgi:hypothetical protein
VPELDRTFNGPSRIGLRGLLGFLWNGRALDVWHSIPYGFFEFRGVRRRKLGEKLPDKYSKDSDTVPPNFSVCKAGMLLEIFGENLDDLWILLDFFVGNPGRADFWFAQVLRAAVQLDPVRGCELASRMIVGDSFPMKGEGEKLIGELAQTYPTEIMEAVGRRIADDATKDYFFVSKFSFLTVIPFEVVKAWLEKVGVVGARAIARHLPPPFLGKDRKPQVPELTRFVLTKFEDDERTFSEFVAGVHSYQGYWGSYSDARQKEALEAKTFLSDVSKRIRQWALLEMQGAEEDARIHGIREDEIGFR